jgi:ankyrin repeat protein
MIELSELQNFVCNNDLDEVLKLVDDQPELLNHIFEGQYSTSNLLQMIVPRNDPELFRALAERGAKPRVSDQHYDNLIYLLLWSAIDTGPASREILQGLIDMGVELPIYDHDACLHFVDTSLEKVFRVDHLETMKNLLDFGFVPVAVERCSEMSLLAHALKNRIGRSSCDIAEFLLEQGCSLDPLSNKDDSPLYYALVSQRYDMVTKLLDSGIDTGRLPSMIYYLVKLDDIPEELLERLLQIQDLNDTVEPGVTALHLSVAKDRPDLLARLLDHGMDINGLTEAGTPLMYAATCKQKKMIKHLIEIGVELNIVNENNQTALDLAQAQAGSSQICNLMIKAGAKSAIDLSGSSSEQDGLRLNMERMIHPGEPWADAARDALRQLDDDLLETWNHLIRRCLDNNSAKPSKKWLKEVEPLVEAIGESSLRSCCLQWFPMLKEDRSADVPEEVAEDYYHVYDSSHVITDNNTRLLKGLAWISSRFDDADMSRALRELATQMYRKVYGIGMRNAKIANAALVGLSMMPGTSGLKEIIVLRAATKYNPARVNIDRVFDKLAEERGQTPDELAELSTPDYGLTGLGELRQQVGEFEAVVRLVSVGKCELCWVKGDKTQETVPAAIKTDHADEIKSLKATVKDVQTGSSAHGLRLEQLYLRRKDMDVATWKEQYLDHRLIGFLARRLIWRVSSGKTSVNVMYCDGNYIDHAGARAKIAAGAVIDLWHPSMSEPDETLAWRNLLIEREITQPFKQAHREIYLLTDAERESGDRSVRFASHVLMQGQFHALAMQRGWSQQRGGPWDGGGDASAHKKLPAYGMTALIEAAGSDVHGSISSGIYDCVVTGEVSFYSDTRVALESIEPLLFSEVMRDVDLFVSVTTIGNDPDWRDRNDAYWSAASFGEIGPTAATRKEVLSALIPKLKVADQLRIDGRFLIVEGKVTTYRIHLGSSNILMAPDDTYLCIVDKPRSGQAVMLPFEGDRILSLILSKAILLANDHKIRDKVILAQIERQTAESA